MSPTLRIHHLKRLFCLSQLAENLKEEKFPFFTVLIYKLIKIPGKYFNKFHFKAITLQNWEKCFSLPYNLVVKQLRVSHFMFKLEFFSDRNR